MSKVVSFKMTNTDGLDVGMCSISKTTFLSEISAGVVPRTLASTRLRIFQLALHGALPQLSEHTSRCSFLILGQVVVDAM
jgi:hypothetical protein